MPKNKSWGENSKAAEARLRKEQSKKSEKSKKEQEREDAYWADDDKHLAKKQNRKDEAEKKRLEKLQKKNENKLLAEQEMSSIDKSINRPTTKIVQAQLAAEKEKREAAARKSAAGNSKSVKELPTVPLVENLNRIAGITEEATTIDEALKLLSTQGSDVDKHPERRMKAAYKAFEEQRMPLLKAENPTLRLSQLKHMLFEEWKRSPSNPMNN